MTSLSEGEEGGGGGREGRATPRNDSEHGSLLPTRGAAAPGRAPVVRAPEVDWLRLGDQGDRGVGNLGHLFVVPRGGMPGGLNTLRLPQIPALRWCYDIRTRDSLLAETEM